MGGGGLARGGARVSREAVRALPGTQPSLRRGVPGHRVWGVMGAAVAEGFPSL